MVRHHGGLLERAAVFQVGGDSGRPEGVVPDLRLDAGRRGAPSDHGVGVRLGQGGRRQRVRPSPDRPEQRPFGSLGEPAAVDIVVQVGLEVVVAGHLVALAALLVQANPQAPVLDVGVLDLHRERRADPRERIDHEADQRAVAQADRRRHVDRVEQGARLRRIEHGRLAALHAVRGPADGRGRVHRHDLARHKPVEQMADRGEALFDRRRRSRAAELLDIGGDMQRLHVGDRRDAGRLAPGQEFPRGDRVGAPGVPVADLGREEFQESVRASGRLPRRRGPGQTDQAGTISRSPVMARTLL